MEILENKALLLRVRNPDKITQSIKKSFVVEQKDDITEIAVHWGLKETQELAKLNFKNIPSPIFKDYIWTGKLLPFEHQKTTASFLTLHKRAFCFNEQGTGKTASVIWAADYLMKLGILKRVLVICPLSIMKPAWQQDLFKFAMHRSCGIAHGTASTRKKVIAANTDFVIINFDGVGVVADEIKNGGFDLIVVDEATAYKSAQTTRWKILSKIVANVEWLWMLTGTPAAQSPIDAFGIARLINPDNTPRFFNQFRDRVMYKLSAFKWMPKPGAKEYVHSILQPAIRFEKKDCLDLPDIIYMDRDVGMTPQQKKYYEELKTELFLEAAGEEVSAINAAVKLSKLLQIACGSVYTDTGEVIDFDASNRMDAVVEVVEEASHKVLVFVPFTHTIELLSKRMEKEGIPYGVIDGSVSVNKRSEIVKKFQEQEIPKVLIIQPQTASHGLTLTAADTIIWYAPITSVETYLQANARIDRPGQKNSMTVVHIKGSEVESRLYTMLRNNINTHNSLIDLYKKIITEPDK